MCLGRLLEGLVSKYLAVERVGDWRESTIGTPAKGIDGGESKIQMAIQKGGGIIPHTNFVQISAHEIRSSLQSFPIKFGRLLGGIVGCA